MAVTCLVAVDVRSSHNVGAFFRTCDGFGAELRLVGITPYPIKNDDKRLPHIARKAHQQIQKTALGAEDSVPWQYYKDLDKCLNDLRKDGYAIYAIEQSTNSIPIQEIPANNKIALVVGREVEGLSIAELKMVDEIYEIPMTGNKESFNVSIAAAIALYQANLIQ